MNIKQTSLVAFFVSCACVATAVAASAPSGVSNVSAAFTGDKLTVQWQAVPETDIDHYNVYYSRESILGNQGNYDDFESTKSAVTTYTFSTAPYKGKKIYVSVMAVNKAGIESESFESEASAEMASTPTLSSAAAPTVASSTSSQHILTPSDVFAPSSATSIASSATSSTDPLMLMRVRGYSQTGVLLEFSKPLNQTQLLTPDQFVIVDSSGSQLTVNRATLSGSNMITLDTAAQVPQKVYVIGLQQNVSGTDTSILATPLPTVTFFGFAVPATGILPYIPNPNVNTPSTTPTPRDLTPPENPTDLSIAPKIRKDGTYDIGAFWVGSINSARDLADYNIYTTTDGVQFVPSEPVGTTSVHFTHVKPGTFGVKVTARDTVGNESSGISKVINLPHSGVGLLGLIAMSGAFAGQRVARKRKQQV